MRRFLIQFGGFLLIQLGVLAVVCLLYAPDPDHYMAALADKHHRAESLSGPRLIVVAGSSGAFGLDSAALGATAGLPVVNMGLHAALGLEFMLESVRRLLRLGDVIVLAPEYPTYWGESFQGALLMDAVYFEPRALRWMWRASWPAVLDEAHIMLSHAAHQVYQRHILGRRFPASPPYARSAFNEFGDNLGQHEMAHRAERPAPWRPTHIDHRRYFSSMRQFATDCAERGAQVFLSYPPVSQAYAQALQSVIDAIHTDLQTAGFIPILGAPQDFVLPDEMFFDTHFHPTPEGKKRRTKKLGESLSAERNKKGGRGR